VSNNLKFAIELVVRGAKEAGDAIKNVGATIREVGEYFKDSMPSRRRMAPPLRASGDRSNPSKQLAPPRGSAGFESSDNQRPGGMAAA
jgi:hypothetical protein